MHRRSRTGWTRTLHACFERKKQSHHQRRTTCRIFEEQCASNRHYYYAASRVTSKKVMVKSEEVKKVAGLAKLEFTESELAELTGELNHILGYIDQLKELDVSQI